MDVFKAVYYASPLRRSVNRIYRRFRRFLYDALPDALVILGSVSILMGIWELCFFYKW